MTNKTEKNRVERVFHKIAIGIKTQPELVGSVNAVYLFRISGPEGGIFHVNLKDNPGICGEEKQAECVLDVRDRDFLKLVKGILPGYKALLNGKLKVKGDLTLATRLNEIFKVARSQKLD
ncbi:MAG: SCP2 sterol-binding domain-containing protein [Proteobacteria bacterium]|nr:SCP2 sterol-binding domain-containing protein [Pseudomonadota bacterium]